VEIAVREAELALVEEDSGAVSRELGLALAIEPGLVLDPDLYPPPLVQRLVAERAKRTRAAKVTVRVESRPPGASVFAAGVTQCCAPLQLRVAPGWHVLWGQREGYRAHQLRFSAPTSGAVILSLAPLTAPERVQGLVSAVRNSSGELERQAAAALLEELKVDNLLIVGADFETWTVVPRAKPNPTLVDNIRAEGLPDGELQAAGVPVWRRHWPTFVAAAVAVGLGVGGAVLGANAAAEARSADLAPFASDGKAVWSSGLRKAQSANLLYAGAAIAGVTGVVLYFTF
jgi:hypothetical protein